MCLQAYMEDHLLHADKLTEEWEELERYVPDDQRVEVGEKNADKNRYPSILPCELTNLYKSLQISHFIPIIYRPINLKQRLRRSYLGVVTLQHFASHQSYRPSPLF
jgi:hypothetical protein